MHPILPVTLSVLPRLPDHQWAEFQFVPALSPSPPLPPSLPTTPASDSANHRLGWGGGENMHADMPTLSPPIMSCDFPGKSNRPLLPFHSSSPVRDSVEMHTFWITSSTNHESGKYWSQPISQVGWEQFSQLEFKLKRMSRKQSILLRAGACLVFVCIGMGRLNEG